MQLGYSPAEVGLLMQSCEHDGAIFPRQYLYVDELQRARFHGTNRASLAELIRRFWFERTKPAFSPDDVRYIDNLLAPG